MNIFKTNDEDSIHWLKVAMRQPLSDIKSLKEEVRMLKEATSMKNEDIKEWLDKEVHKDGLGITDIYARYEELAEASSKCLLWAGDPVREGFYYGSLNGEYLKLREIRSKLFGIDLEDY